MITLTLHTASSKEDKRLFDLENVSVRSGEEFLFDFEFHLRSRTE